MIIPSSVTDSIAAAGIDVSNDWLSATAPVWNADYSAVLTQPISIAVTPLADMRFLGVTTATITIRISSAPLSLVSWSGIATLVADDTTGGGSPIYPVHNSFTGRDVADAHPLASITGLVDALDGKAPAFVSDDARLFWATPEVASGIPSLRHVTYADLTGAGLVVQNNGASYVDLYGDGVSSRSSATRAIGIARDGRFALLNASVNVAFAIANASIIDAYSDRVSLSQKLQFNGVDTITLARGADFSTLKVGATTGFVRSVTGRYSASPLVSSDLPVFYENHSDGAMSPTGSGGTNALVQSATEAIGSLTTDVAPMFSAGKAIEFEFSGTGVSNASAGNHSTGFRVASSALGFSPITDTITVAFPSGAMAYKWNVKARVFGRYFNKVSNPTLFTPVIFLEYTVTLNGLSYTATATAIGGTVDAASAINATWTAEAIEGSALLPASMHCIYSRIK